MKSLATAVICAGITLSAYAQSPYIYKVWEFCPAPGQFVNELPPYEKGDTANEMRLKAEEYIEGTTGMLVSLGGYGGYIIFGFDHMVKNVEGEYDFKILANAFYANANPNPDAPREGGSCEPGIVMVSYDANGNGRPDDEWYELAGSEYNSPETIHNYRITYYRPDENKDRVPMDGYEFINDLTYIRWTTNQPDQSEGYLYRNTFHDQSYWPQWIDCDELTFQGTKLADNYIDESHNGSYYVLYAYPWGYVDNHPNNDPRAGFKIDWAVDSEGNAVKLPGINFVKVYTGVNQYCGWLGETSTEIIGAYDLHLIGDEPDLGGVGTPRNLSCRSTENTIECDWDAPENGEPKGYNVYLNDGLYRQVTETHCTIKDLQPYTFYNVKVESFLDGATFSDQVEVLVRTTDETNPTAPAGIRISDITAYTATVTWEPAEDNVGIDNYFIYLDGKRAGMTPADETSFLLAPLTPDKQYIVEVEARDKAGNASMRAEASFTTASSGIKFIGIDKMSDSPGFRDTIHIESSIEQPLSLWSANGILKLNVQLQKGSNSIDISGLPAGIYIMRCASMSRKLIIQ